MDKLKMHSPNKVDKNVELIGGLFPNCLVETKNDKGQTETAIDFDVLRQELSQNIVEGNKERYQFTWPEKRKSILLANSPIEKTLRPCREESVDFDNTENLYIEGDNLDVLKLLQETYLNKVKMIYVDPPYNTGKDFVYEDKFAQSTSEYLEKSGQYDEDGNRLVQNNESAGRFHTKWLNMIYPRLKVAKDLLTDDGVVFISIDDHEVENLKKICNEIFGKQNFVAQFIHKNNSNKNQANLVSVSCEYFLCYSKNIEILNKKIWRIEKKGAKHIVKVFNQLKGQGLELTDILDEIKDLYKRPKYAHLSRWNHVDSKGVFMDADLSREGGAKNHSIVNPETGKLCPIPPRGWAKSKDELEQLFQDDMIYFGDPLTPPRIKSYLTGEDLSVPDSFWYIDNSIDTRWQKQTFNSLIFENPKPLELIRLLMEMSSAKDSIVLDFFSGSATTAHAVMKLNAEDGGHRKFMMVQFPEETDKKSEACKAGYKNICEIGKERIRRAGKEIVDELEEKERDDNFKLDIGFRVLKLDSTNMKDVYYDPSKYTPELFLSLTDNIKEDRTPEDLLFQVMLELGVPLSYRIEDTTINGKHIFNVNNNYLIACFDDAITDETVEYIAKQKPQYAVFRDSSMGSDSVATNFDQLFKTYSPDTTRRVL